MRVIYAKTELGESSMRKRIAVIGGGLSGLATAFYLRRFSPDCELALFEAADRLGGVIGTERVEVPGHGCFVIDHGADMFAIHPPDALQLCKDLGVDDQLILPDTAKAGAEIVYRGRLVPIPDGFVLMRATKIWQMITTPLLSVRAKLRFLGERFVKDVYCGRNGPAKDTSVAEFVRQRMGAEVLDRLVGPLVAGIYTADVEKLSLNATMAPIVEMVKAHGSLAQATIARRRASQDSAERNSAGARYQNFRGFPNGMGQLIETLADRIGRDSIRTQVAVRSLQYDASAPHSWTLGLGATAESFDEVVLATPAAVSARLLGDVSDASVRSGCQRASDGLAAIESASAAIVVLCVPKSQIARLPNRFGFVVPPIEGRRILAGSFASHKYPVRCPADHVIVRVFVGGALQPELLEQTDEQITEMVREELAELIGMTGKETLLRVVRWNHAMPQYHVGHLDRAAEIEQAIAAVPQLSLVTNALRGVGIAPVIAAAKSTAQSVGR